MLKSHQKCLGYTLVEALIGLAIGAYLIAATIIAFSHLSSTTGEAVKTARLVHELKSSLALMVTDLRRSGYWAHASAGVGSGANNNPFTQAGTTDLMVNVSNDCITFSYDVNQDGVIPSLNTSPSDERFGYRLINNKIQSRPEFHTSLDCAANESAWINLTDSDVVSISELNFTLDTEAVTLSAGTLSRRTVSITLTGNLVSDANVSRTLQETVYIRNDLFTP